VAGQRGSGGAAQVRLALKMTCAMLLMGVAGASYESGLRNSFVVEQKEMSEEVVTSEEISGL